MQKINLITLFTLSGILCLSILICLTLTLKNPIDKGFDKLVKDVMATEQFDTVEEVMTAYPNLKELQSKIARCKKWEYDVRLVQNHPAPPKEEARLVLQQKLDAIQHLRTIIKLELEQLERDINWVAKEKSAMSLFLKQVQTL